MVHDRVVITDEQQVEPRGELRARDVLGRRHAFGLVGVVMQVRRIPAGRRRVEQAFDGDACGRRLAGAHVELQLRTRPEKTSARRDREPIRAGRQLGLDAALAIELGKERAAAEILDERFLALRDRDAGIGRVVRARIAHVKLDATWRVEREKSRASSLRRRRLASRTGLVCE